VLISSHEMGDDSCSRSSSRRGSRRWLEGPTDDTLASIYTSIRGLTAELQSLRSAQMSGHRRLEAIEQDHWSSSQSPPTPTGCQQGGQQCSFTCRNVMHKPLRAAVDCWAYAEQPPFPRVSPYHDDGSLAVLMPPPCQERLQLQRFTGKEDWCVWFGKFSVLTDRHCYSQEDKLTELLQLLDGPAAEFVFGHLPTWTLYDYHTLMYEIEMRFRVVRTPKMYAAQFTHRDQQLNESLEGYAADLKSLYHKAYPERDPQTRQEDLLQRFLDGLHDQEARARVEFHKEPGTIDDAVNLLVVLKQLAADCRRTSLWRSLNTEGPLLVA